MRCSPRRCAALRHPPASRACSMPAPRERPPRLLQWLRWRRGKAESVPGLPTAEPASRRAVSRRKAGPPHPRPLPARQHSRPVCNSLKSATSRRRRGRGAPAAAPGARCRRAPVASARRIRRRRRIRWCKVPPLPRAVLQDSPRENCLPHPRGRPRASSRPAGAPRATRAARRSHRRGAVEAAALCRRASGERVKERARHRRASASGRLAVECWQRACGCNRHCRTRLVDSRGGSSHAYGVAAAPLRPRGA
eukprot:365723-Chlamydomonas_euryale.AAC.2